jgi:hypothetical protein
MLIVVFFMVLPERLRAVVRRALHSNRNRTPPRILGHRLKS